MPTFSTLHLDHTQTVGSEIMDQWPNPHTAAFNPCFEDPIWDGPAEWQLTGRGDPDLFSHAFAMYNSQPMYHAQMSDIEWNGAESYISPPWTNSSPAETDKSPTESAHCVNLDWAVEFPDLPNSVIYPTPQVSPQSNFAERISCTPQETQTPIPILDARPEAAPVKPKRKRNRKPISAEAKRLKHIRFLERNRIAANNCRQRKKASCDGLEDKSRMLELNNTLLKNMRADLIAEVKSLKEIARAMDSKENGDDGEVSQSLLTQEHLLDIPEVYETVM